MTSRADVDALRAGLPGGDAAFDEPWELRALALAVAAHQAGHFAWADFQAALVASTRAWEAAPAAGPYRYYERWLEALESVLASAGVTAGDLAVRRAAVSAVLLAAPPAADHTHAPRREPIAVHPAM